MQEPEKPNLDQEMIKQYVRRIIKTRQGEIVLSDARFRRRAGMILGALAGGLYSLLADGVNLLLLPGLPLDQPPFGLLGNLLMWIGMGGILGLVCAWPAEGTPAIALGMLVVVLEIVVRQFILVRSDSFNPLMRDSMTALTLACVPLMFVFLLPVPAFIRLAVEQLDAQAGKSLLSLQRSKYAMVLLAIALFGGVASIYPQDTRSALNQLNQLVQSGLAASLDAELPARLQKVEGFRQNAIPPYQLMRDNGYLAVFETRELLARSKEEYRSQITLVARFHGGYRIICLIPYPGSEPFCRPL